MMAGIDIDESALMVETGKPPRVASALINGSVAETLSKLGNVEDVRASYVRAMVMATKLWKGDSSLVRPCSPEHIKIVTGFNYKTQWDYKLLLTKTEAFAFLNDVGKPIEASTSFKKKYSNNKASTSLNRVAATINGSTLVCTYAEWLYLEDFPYEPELPQDLLSFLPSGWMCPNPEVEGANIPFTPPPKKK